MNLGKPVTPGQKLSVPADLMNVLRRMAQDYLAGDATGSGVGAASGHPEQALIRNDSGETVSRFGVLGIDGVIFTPDDDLTKFQSGWAFKGVTPAVPDHVGKFVICLDAIPNTRIGRGLLLGNIAVQVNVNDEGDEWADVLDGDATQLDSGGSGAAHILYKQSGTGTKWAVVRIGSPGTAGLFPVTVEKIGGDEGDTTTQCSFIYAVKDLSGNKLGAGMSPAKPRPALGAQVAQAGTDGYGTGFYNADGDFVLWDAGEVPAVNVCGDECEEAGGPP